MNAALTPPQSNEALADEDVSDAVPDSRIRLTPLPPTHAPDEAPARATRLESFTRRLGLPYVGLRAFRESDRDVFYGRERELTALVDILDTQHFAAVVGPRHSGRTSLVEAGVIGSLKERDGRDVWQVARLNVAGASEPEQELRRALTALCQTTAPSTERHREAAHLVAASLDGAADALLRAAEHALSDDDQRLLLVVEGFATLTVRPGPAEQLFVRQLLRATRERSASRVFVVLVLGEDTLSACGQFPGLAGALAGGMVVLEHHNRDQLRAMITEPLKAVKWRVTPALCEQLLRDVDADEDPLPRLQHALLRMADHAKATGVIDLTTYVAAGCPDALDTHGRTLLESLSEPQRALARAIFCALLTTSSGEALPRTCSIEELARSIGVAPSDPNFRKVVSTFSSNECGFLRAGTNAAPTLELGHPLLLTEWHALEQWAEDELLDGQKYRQLLSLARREHGASGETGSRNKLLREPELTAQEAWWSRRQPTAQWALRHTGLGTQDNEAGLELITEFLRRSRELEQAEESTRRETERTAKLEAERRRHRRKLALSFGAAALVLSAAAIVAVVHQRDSARGEARAAEARFATAAEDNVRLRRTKARLAAELDESKREAESLEGQLQLLESERDSLIGTGTALQQALDALQKRHDLIVRAHDAALIRAQETLAELRRAQRELAAATARANAATRELEGGRAGAL